MGQMQTIILLTLTIILLTQLQELLIQIRLDANCSNLHYYLMYSEGYKVQCKCAVGSIVRAAMCDVWHSQYEPFICYKVGKGRENVVHLA